jgi:hypothetical protein
LPRSVTVIAPSARRSGGGTCAADQHTKRPHRTLRTLTTYPAPRVLLRVQPQT